MSDVPSNRVLVSGSAGFVGRHVVAALLKRGHRVVALQRHKSLPPEIAAGCDRVLSGDICDSDFREQVLQDVQAVCHLSAHVPAQINDLDEAVKCYQVNAQATLALAKTAAEMGVSRFVHLSTGNMYAPSAAPCQESDPVYPQDHATGYFVSKLAAELYLGSIARQQGMETIILRLGTPYGPGEPAGKVIPTFLKRAAQGQPLSVVAGPNRFNFVYISDVADCIVSAAENGPSGIYNLSSGEHTSLLDLAQAVARLFPDRQVEVRAEPAKPGTAPGFPAMSIAKARATWGFAPLPLSRGLLQYRSHLAAGATP